MCEHRVSIRLGPRSVGGAWARVSPEIIDCESLAVYHLFRQTGQTWSAARPGSANRTTEHAQRAEVDADDGRVSRSARTANHQSPII